MKENPFATDLISVNWNLSKIVKVYKKLTLNSHVLTAVIAFYSIPAIDNTLIISNF